MLACCLLLLSRVGGTLDCESAVPSFVDNLPTDLSDVDLAIARLRLLPLYQRKCQRFATELDAYEARLEREQQLRMESS
jgi:hypothetical protein